MAAESSKKALISASLGELNTNNSPWRFEYNLRRVLQYDTIWKAVVLLDEADVFLESREDSSSTPDRNALVAVFLKKLEYFSGIVFLTTNRLGSFDQAMKSRIHLALGYAAPDIEARRQIWTRVLGRIPEEEMGIKDINSEIESLLRRISTAGRYRMRRRRHRLWRGFKSGNCSSIISKAYSTSERSLTGACGSKILHEGSQARN